MSKPPFNPFNSTFSTVLSLVSLLNSILYHPHNWHLSLFTGSTTVGKVQIPSARSAPQTTHSRNIAPAPPPPTNSPLFKVSLVPHRTAPNYHLPKDEHFPCVSWYLLYMQSPCHSFDIDATRPIHHTPSRRWHFRWTNLKMIVVYKGNFGVDKVGGEWWGQTTRALKAVVGVAGAVTYIWWRRRPGQWNLSWPMGYHPPLGVIPCVFVLVCKS